MQIQINKIVPHLPIQDADGNSLCKVQAHQFLFGKILFSINRGASKILEVWSIIQSVTVERGSPDVVKFHLSNSLYPKGSALTFKILSDSEISPAKLIIYTGKRYAGKDVIEENVSITECIIA